MNIPGTHLIADKFTKPSQAGEHVYFLSHFHSDHMSGLTPKWKRGLIFCTVPTRKLLINRFPDLESAVKGMEYNTEYSISTEDGIVRVRAFDANHIIGSCMFLFEGSFGKVLYTGDFRFTEEMLHNEYLYPPHKKNPKNKAISIQIDLLILDNTFCDPIYSFPTQSDAFIEIVKIVQDHPLSKIVLFLYNVGKEEILVKLAHIFSTAV